MNQRQRFGRNGCPCQQGVDDSHVGHVNAQFRCASRFQAFYCQHLCFKVCFGPSVAVNFSTKLQWFTGGVWPVGLGMQHRAAVAQARHAGAVQQMRINTGDLWRCVGPQAERAARQLVNQLEGL